MTEVLGVERAHDGGDLLAAAAQPHRRPSPAAPVTGAPKRLRTAATRVERVGHRPA